MKRNLGIYLGLLCSLPVCVWAAGAMTVDGVWQPVKILRSAVETIWLLQALAIAVYPHSRLDRESLAEHGLLILTPLPIVAIAWLAGAVEASAIPKALACLLIFSILIQSVRSVIGKLPPLASCQPAFGLALAVLAWRYFENWLVWFGP